MTKVSLKRNLRTGRLELKFDDKEVPAMLVQKIELKIEAPAEVPYVTITFVPGEVEVDLGPEDVTIGLDQPSRDIFSRCAA